jgi:hypothetical protein
MRCIEGCVDVGRIAASNFAEDLSGHRSNIFKILARQWFDESAIDPVVIPSFKSGFASRLTRGNIIGHGTSPSQMGRQRHYVKDETAVIEINLDLAFYPYKGFI